MDDKQFGALLVTLNRIAAALEAAHQPPDDDQTITLPIGMFGSFDWAQINCREFASDDFGSAQVFCMADGRVYTRRTNDKFGSEIWFSRGNGKNADGTARYKRLIEFREIKDAEPIGRKAEVALKQAPTTHPALSPPAGDKPSGPVTLSQVAAQVIPQRPALAPKREPIPEADRAAWLAAYDAAVKVGRVPIEWNITAEDTVATLAVKANALRLMAAPPATEADPLADEIAAVKTMLAEHTGQYIRAAVGASKSQIADTKAALARHAGGDAGVKRVLIALLGKDSLSFAQVLAVFDWLKPARGTDGIYAANRDARELVKQIAAQAEPQAQAQTQQQLQPEAA